MLSVILPAHQEADWIAPCLTALFASDPVPGGAEAVVVANGCTDATAAVAQGMAG
ncbi:MAG: glycosyltransferase, partial [Rhodobacterales bacterium]|nr:glycosyltransferase [Rhodobacterales bacterium]